MGHDSCTQSALSVGWVASILVATKVASTSEDTYNIVGEMSNHSRSEVRKKTKHGPGRPISPEYGENILMSWERIETRRKGENLCK